MNEAPGKANLQDYIAREKSLLPQADTYDHGRPVYGLSRSAVATFARPAIEQMIKEGQGPAILEIGGGKGRALEKILEDHQEIAPSSLTMTSLSPLPEHEK